MADYNSRGWRRLAATTLRASAACGAMTLAFLAALEYTPAVPGLLAGRAIAVAWPLLAGAAVYLLAARLVRLDEVWILVRRQREIVGRDLALERSRPLSLARRLAAIAIDTPTIVDLDEAVGLAALADPTGWRIATPHLLSLGAAVRLTAPQGRSP